MPSKKVIAGLLGIIVAISVVALIPVFMYGFTVKIAEIETSIGLSSTDGGSGPELQQATNLTVTSFNVDVDTKKISPYEYIFSNMERKVRVVEEGSSGLEIVNIFITLDLTTPSNKSLSFSFNPRDLTGEGLKNIIITLGPDSLNGEDGIFHLTITISIIVTLLDITIVELDLTPVNLSFNI